VSESSEFCCHNPICCFSSSVCCCCCCLFRYRLSPETFGCTPYISLGYGLYDRGFDSRWGLGTFLFTTVSRLALGPTQWVPRTFSLGVKQQERKVDYSPQSSAEVQNAWSYTSTPQYTFLTWCSVKITQGQLYIYIYLFLFNEEESKFNAQFIRHHLSSFALSRMQSEYNFSYPSWRGRESKIEGRRKKLKDVGV
jgi:hypothetical protein